MTCHFRRIYCGKYLPSLSWGVAPCCGSLSVIHPLEAEMIFITLKILCCMVFDIPLYLYCFCVCIYIYICMAQWLVCRAHSQEVLSSIHGPGRCCVVLCSWARHFVSHCSISFRCKNELHHLWCQDVSAHLPFPWTTLVMQGQLVAFHKPFCPGFCLGGGTFKMQSHGHSWQKKAFTPYI